MPTKGEWALIALILGAIAFAGVAIYLTRKNAPQGLSLKRINQPQQQIQQEPRVVLQNEERAELIHDGEGVLTEIIVHRKIIE
jgi:hypothetical protein